MIIGQSIDITCAIGWRQHTTKRAPGKLRAKRYHSSEEATGLPMNRSLPSRAQSMRIVRSIHGMHSSLKASTLAKGERLEGNLQRRRLEGDL